MGVGIILCVWKAVIIIYMINTGVIIIIFQLDMPHAHAHAHPQQTQIKIC